MNNNVKGLLLFLTGGVVGSVSTYFAVKKYFELKADIEVESVRDAYNRRVSELEPSVNSLDGDIEGPETIDDGRVHLDGAKSSIARELNNKPPLTDYTKFFKEKDERTSLDLKEITRDPKEEVSEDELAEAEGPTDDEPYTDEEDEDETLNFEDHQLNGKHKKAMEDDTPPYLIDKSDYDLTCSNYDKITLLYYIADDIVINEDNEIEGNVRSLIGDMISEEGFDQNDEEVMYVRNDKLTSDFEIQKVYSEYTGEND